MTMDTSAANLVVQHPAARAAAPVLAAQAPAVWPQVAPWLDALFQALAQGHSYVPLSPAAAENLSAAAPLVGAEGDFAPLIVSQQRLFLGRIWQLEQDIAADLLRLAAAPVAAWDEEAAMAGLAQWFAEPGSEDQQAAAALALLQPLMMINGGPGTGKTTTVAKLLALLCHNRPDGRLPRIALAAPTGKAAAHMGAALQRALDGFSPPPLVAGHLRRLQGQTVHRLLALRPPLLTSPYDADSPLPLDILVVDEASMLDLSLLHTLLRALPTGCRLLLLGDRNQLPPVGAGDVLAALAQPTRLDAATAAAWQRLLPKRPLPFAVAASAAPLAAHTATLGISHRFDDRSGIGRLAAAVVSGDTAAAAAAFADFPSALRQGHRADWPQLYAAQHPYWQAVAAGDAQAVFAALSAVVVLAARRQDAADFNQGYRRWLAAHGHAALQNWFAGQMLMVTQNDYGVGLFNGDIGVVLPDADGRLQACFAGSHGIRRIGLSRLPPHEDAFALTVHKSQGSEYRHVWLLPPAAAAGEDVLFERSLLYTALTRARDGFVLLGDPALLAEAIRQQQPRRSGLPAALVRQAGLNWPPPV